jgi:hypothetical protein
MNKIAFMVFFLLFSSCQRGSNQDFLSSNPERFLINISAALGENWDNESVHQWGKEDFLGTDISIIAHYVTGAHHAENNLAYIRQHIILYRDYQSALSRYQAQHEWIFVYNFGVPPSRQIFSFEELELPEATIAYADSYRVECLQTIVDNQCIALIHYKNLVLVIDAFLVRDGRLFLEETDFARIINLVESSIVTIVIDSSS